MQSIIQILRVNDPKTWAFEGRTGKTHTYECIGLNDDGSPQWVGVLKVKGTQTDMVSKLDVGHFLCSFGVQPNPQSRQIEAVLTDVRQVKKAGAGFVPVDAPTAPASPVKV